MRFVSFNIQFGRGRDQRIDLARTAAAVRGADVIACQEVERFWTRSGDVDQPAALAEHLPEYFWVYGGATDVDASTVGADGRIHNRRRQHGTMLLARTPIRSSRLHLLPKRGSLDQYTLQRGALEGVIETASGALRIYSVHLNHNDDETRLAEVDALLALSARAYGEGGAFSGAHHRPDEGWLEGGEPPMPREALMMGDFNFTLGSPCYDRIAGPMTRNGRIVPRDGFADAWVAAGHAEGAGVTIPRIVEKRGPGAPARIDFCFVHADLRARVKAAWIDDACAASDHQPLWTEIDL